MTATKEKETFSFNAENKKRVKQILAKYPAGRQKSGTIPLLDLAQRQNGGWLSIPAIEHVAEVVNEPYIRVYEVASFYSMFNLKPVGKHFIQVCRTTPCWLRGSDEITETCKRKLGIGLKETTKDGQFTLVEVECLGACANAPMVQINDDYYEDLNAQRMERLIDDLQAEREVKVGSQAGRYCSAPMDGLTTLQSLDEENE
ncbi:MAG: NADH-quinone oxidoreductase subunit NuoE [Hyphomicrobiales bacterium]|nr:NADH-quinone oxidoreductase subunit NuoE [Rickettsiales bacterium]MCP5362051.1 NADH-quinone oxidoreductase subunit NuoE [Hyphomicrobiales bacterium]